MDSLMETVQKMNERMRVYQDDLGRNEMMTRYALVDPFLTALGWDISDPGMVIPEDDGAGMGRRIRVLKSPDGKMVHTNPIGKNDYTIRKNGADVMVVEAKTLGKLDDSRKQDLEKYRKQLFKYMKNRGVRYGILTDGWRWIMYGMRKEKPDDPILTFRIDPSKKDISAQAERLKSWYWESLPLPSKDAGLTRER